MIRTIHNYVIKDFSESLAYDCRAFFLQPVMLKSHIKISGI